MKVICLFLFLSLSIFAGCSHREQASNIYGTSIKMKLSYDNSNVELYPLPDYAIEAFKGDTLSQKQYENLFAIYVDAKDESLQDLQKPVQGTYYLTDTSILFKPQQTFKKNQNYVATCQIKNLIVEPTEIIRSRKLPGKDKPQEFIFKIDSVKQGD